MRPVVRIEYWLTFALATACLGCANNPYILQGQLTDLQKQYASVDAMNKELLSRAQRLDQDNQDLETLLAQSRQQSRVVEDEVAALRDQLKTASSQIAKLREESEAIAKSEASGARGKPHASITANSSLREQMPRFTMQGVESRFDGDVVRVEVSADILFDPQDARLKPDATRLLDDVAGELARSYPDQLIGLEGHTDNEPIPPGGWPSHHHLALARATSVYDYVSVRTRLRPQQMFLVAHGSNHPVVSNATPAGRQRNRRIEFVIYPEKYGK